MTSVNTIGRPKWCYRGERDSGVSRPRLASLLGQLEDAEFGSIAIRPFTLTYDGVTFGLIDESGPDRGSWAELYPDRLGFSDPWDGTYST